MNNYKSKSKLYRIFVWVERTPITNTVRYTKVYIPKIQCSLTLNLKTDQFQHCNIWNTYTEASVRKSLSFAKDNGGESNWIEVNHFKIEDGFIDILKSKVELDLILASEILKTRIEELNLVKQ